MINIHDYFAVNWEATSDNIKSLIKNNVSCATLAEAMCVSKRTVENWCNNKAKPSIDSLILIAKLFNLDLLDILVTNGQLGEQITDKDYNETCEKVKHCYAKKVLYNSKFEINSKEEVYNLIVLNELVKTTYPVTTLDEFLLILPLVNFPDLQEFFIRINGNIGTNKDYVYNQLKYLYDNIPNDKAKKYVSRIKEYYLTYPSVNYIYEDSQLPIKLLKSEKYIETTYKTDEYKKMYKAYKDKFEDFLNKLFNKRKSSSRWTTVY